MISALACDANNRNCMIHRCEFCADSASLKILLYAKLSTIDGNETILVEQWISTDRADSKTIIYTKDELVEDTVIAINKLAAHSYIAKSQSNYLARQEPIILAHFAKKT